MKKAGLKKLEPAALEALYLAESTRLNEALLAGTAWEDLAEQRKYVTTIGVVIDSKRSAKRNALVAAALQPDISFSHASSLAKK